MSADEELRLRELVRLALGSLACELPEGACGCLRYTLTLPTAEQIPVLVVDDNADALQLFGRYLAGSRFRFLGAANANTALTLAARDGAPRHRGRRDDARRRRLDAPAPSPRGPADRLHPDRRVLDSGPAWARRSARRVRFAAQADHTRRDAGGSGSPARPGSARCWVTNSIPSTTVWMVSPPARVKAKALLAMGWPCGSRAEITSTGISSRLALPVRKELESIQPRHSQVQQDAIRPSLGHHLERLSPITRQPYPIVPPGRGQHALEKLPARPARRPRSVCCPPLLPLSLVLRAGSHVTPA